MDNTTIDRFALEEKLHDLSAPPIPLPFEFLKDITSNFSSEQELGRGGYGVVYKGVLQSGKIIAVKKLFDTHLVDDDQFQKDVANLVAINHINIVRLLGYCAESRWEARKLPNGQYAMAQIPTRLLCFEYLPNQSLEKHVSGMDRYELEEKLHDPSASPIPMPFEFLKDITGNFSSEQELGRGGYGIVYKGVLRSGKIIAVKKLFEMHLVSDDQFQKEVTNLVGINHDNIVPLVGYCAESRWEAINLPNGHNVMAQIPTRLLCFEYLPNKSLEKHISDECSGLDWNKRYDMIMGIVSGLHFLHQKCHIVHLDLKPENILMDATMTPKIADFGLSRLLDPLKSQTMILGSVAGSRGYMAPEYLLEGVVSPKADLFSLGKIIMEIVTGQKDCPLTSVSAFLQLNTNHSPNNMEISLGEYKDNVLAKWSDVFEKEPNDTSPETYIDQVQQCINGALECVDPDSTRRPDVCELFEMITGEICSCGEKTLLMVQPSELLFDFGELYQQVMFCHLQLTNNTDDVVAFRIVINNNLEHLFPQPAHGHVLPRSMYNVRVVMRRPPEDINRFKIKLQCTTIVGGHYQPSDIQGVGLADHYNHFFTEAKNNGRDIQQVKLLVLTDYMQGKGNNWVIQSDFERFMCVHPTKTWIITMNKQEKCLYIRDYETKEKVLQTSELFDSSDEVLRAICVPRKQWLVAGFENGYIKVYSFETMQEVKAFRAHYNSIWSLDIHPRGPYVLSACYKGKTVKLWNWEKGWECIRTFDTGAQQVKFNPKDANYFACVTEYSVQIWNIASPSCDGPTFSLDSSETYDLDYFTRGDELCLITRHDQCVKIWDWQRRICLKTIHDYVINDGVTAIYAHPDCPLLITGSFMFGTVCLWNSFTFELEGELNFGLGSVYSITGLSEPNRIVINHSGGIAIAEI